MAEIAIISGVGSNPRNIVFKNFPSPLDCCSFALLSPWSSSKATPSICCVSMDGGTTRSTFETSTSDSSGVGDDRGRLSNNLPHDGCDVHRHLDGVVVLGDLPLATAVCEKEFATRCCDDDSAWQATSNGANVTLKPPIENGCRYSTGADQSIEAASISIIEGPGVWGFVGFEGGGSVFCSVWRGGRWCCASTQCTP